jgi:hypothetical protein
MISNMASSKQPSHAADRHDLRIGLSAKRGRLPRPPFKVKPLPLEPIDPNLDFDNIEALLDQVEGPSRR